MLLACGARGPGFDSRPRHSNFQRFVISCFQVAIWLKYRWSDVNPQYNQPTSLIIKPYLFAHNFRTLLFTFSICGLTCRLMCVCPMEMSTLLRKSDSSRLSTAAPSPSITVMACFCSMSLSMSHSNWFSLFIWTIFGNKDFNPGSVSKNLKKVWRLLWIEC